jgi:hypothetical protein
VIKFSALTHLDGGSFYIYNDEEINFDWLKLVTIKNRNITADGITLNLANCETLENVGLILSNGGIIQLPKLKNISDIGTANYTSYTIETLPLPSSSLVYDLSQIETIKNQTITADSVTLNLTTCQTLDNVNLVAQNGAIMKFPKLVSYSPTTTSTWTATGANSRLEFDKLTSINASSSKFTITGSNGGIVSLPELEYDLSGNVAFEGGGFNVPKLKAILGNCLFC